MALDDRALPGAADPPQQTSPEPAAGYRTRLAQLSGLDETDAVPKWAGTVIALVLLFAIGMQEVLKSGVTIGDALLLLTVPIWFSAYRRYAGAGPFLALGLVTAVAGITLSEYNSGARILDHSMRRDATMLMIGLVASIAAVLWAREVLSHSQIGVSYGLGMLVSAVTHPSMWSTDPWKFAFAIPVSVLVLGVTARYRRTLPSIIALLVLAAISFVFDSRAFGVTLALAALILLWRSLPKRTDLRYSWLWSAALLAGGTALVYSLASSLLVDGYLGQNVQARTVSQIQTSGSLILGGRPELAATWALMRHDISGFGVGIVPSDQDVLTAKAGLQSINYDPNNGYVEQYMFAGHFELHSVLGDVWTGWGVAGLILLAAVAFLMIRALAVSVARRTGDALVVYVCLWTLWNLMFSPLTPALPILVLGVGLALPRRRERPAQDAQEGRDTGAAAALPGDAQ